MIEKYRWYLICLFIIVVVSSVFPVYAQTGSSTPTPLYQDGRVLLEDDFEDGDARGWVLGNNWGVVQDDEGNYVLEARNSDYAEARRGETSWYNYALEFRAKIIQRSTVAEIQALFRNDPSRKGCQRFRLLLGEDTTTELSADALGDALWNCFGQQTNSDAVVYIPNKWYSIRIEAFQAQIRVYIDGELVITLDNDEPLYSGAIGFIGTSGAITNYDNVRVIELIPFGADAAAPPLPTPTAAPPIVSVADNTLFAEDFQADAFLDMRTSGNWYVETDSSGNRFLCNESSDNWLAINLGDATWRDYTVEMRLKFRSFSGTNSLNPDFTRDDFGLQFRVGANRHYVGTIWISEPSSGVGLGYVESEIWDGFIARGLDFTVNTWYTLHAEALGDLLRWYINGRLTLLAHDTRSTNGSIGIYISPNSEICIDDITVQEVHVFVPERYITVKVASANLRSGPGTEFEQMGVASAGASFPVVTESGEGDNLWYQVLLPFGEQAWIRSDLVIASDGP
ncbi:MAG: SH3 domain-containing protein [Anaerolineaceae bacterium]|nr:SH3 domain-containing protein [Anaerolineaceae bacterium]